MNHPQRGYTLGELLLTLAIIAMLLLVFIPSATAMRERAAIGSAAGEIRGVFTLARSQAISRGRNVGVKFLVIGGEWQYAFYLDGNGNGVRNAEITKGIDPMIRPYEPVLRGTGAGWIGLPKASLADPTDSGVIKPDASPIRFGTSTICSFAPIGSATSGSIFLTGGSNTASVLIVYGPTARIRMMRWIGGKWMKQ
jgi:prepilin-type N-terminal cleavage/methylation domain-containing protein